MALPLSPQNPLSADTYRLPVAFALVDGRRVIGWLSLSRRSRSTAPQTVLERLNERVRLFPVVHSGATHLVMRDAIMWVIPSPGVDPAQVSPPARVPAHEEFVAVALRTGDVLAGRVEVEQRRSSDRTSDFLAGPEDFFLLRTADGPRLIHKHQVVEARLGAEPASATTPRRRTRRTTTGKRRAVARAHA